MATIPKPRVGDVLRANFRFSDGEEKERPVVVMVVGIDPHETGDENHVLLVPITHALRRKGDISHSVLKEVSPYMKNLYSITDLLKLP